MKKLGKLQSNKSVEISTIAIVRNRCQFCYAFFKDPEKIAEHSNQCKFRFSETFEAFDGILKFACAVSYSHQRSKYNSFHVIIIFRSVLMYSKQGLTSKGTSDCMNSRAAFRAQFATKYS